MHARFAAQKACVAEGNIAVTAKKIAVNKLPARCFEPAVSSLSPPIWRGCGDAGLSRPGDGFGTGSSRQPQSIPTTTATTLYFCTYDIYN